MRYFYPEFHTAENLRLQIQQVYSVCSGAYMVGSLGRAGIYGELLGNTAFEYQKRGQDPLRNGDYARDIDFIGVDPNYAAHTLPFWVDATSYSNSDACIRQEGSTWFLTTGDGFYEEIDEAIMEPHMSETVYGVSCLLPPAETLLALQKARGQFRQKDEFVFDLLSHTIEKYLNRPKMPDSLFNAFDKLHQLSVMASTTR